MNVHNVYVRTAMSIFVIHIFKFQLAGTIACYEAPIKSTFGEVLFFDLFFKKKKKNVQNRG